MTALDPTGLLPDSTTLESLYDQGRITLRTSNILAWHNDKVGRGWQLPRPIVTVGDVRELGTELRRVIRDAKACTNILAAIRTDWRPDLSPGYAADAEPAESPRDEHERLRAEYAVRGQQLDDALHRIEGVQSDLARALLRATVAEAKLEALTQAARTAECWFRGSFGVYPSHAPMTDLRILLDEQAGDGGGR